SGSTYRIEKAEFADGTVWNSTILNAKTTTASEYADFYWGTASEYADFYWGTASANTYDGLAGDDRIFGFGGNDTLRGGEGNDFIDGGIGNDIMIGGTGDDTYVVDSATDTVTELAGEGVDTVQASVTHTLAANVENLTLLDAGGAINGTGNELDNILLGNASANILSGGAGNDQIEGGAGNDTLDGGAGADVMIGGTGSDTYVVDDAGDVVIELAGQGTDTVQSSIGYVLGDNLEKLTLTGTAAIDGTGNELNNTLTGNSAANTLIGGAGNDSLNGGAGADILIGGIGDDTYTVDNAGDVVTELEGEGNDTVHSSIDWTLGATLENLTLTGSANRVGTGNALDNVLTGNSGNNTLYGLAGNDWLDGGAGTDTLIGGTGDDTYVVDNAGDIVTENAGEGTDTVRASVTHTLAANVENLILTGSTAINGTGNTLDNVITGNAANNTLTGGAGADTLIGGLGDDIYVVDALDTVVENAGEGIDTVQAGFTYTLGANLEKLTLTGSSAINGYGNELDNTLTGNSAANVLAGGLGNDTYVIGATDTVVEYDGEGTDTVQASFSYALTANVENLTLTGSSAINATGNELDNMLTGNSGANVLMGLAGNDWLDGKAGADTMIGGAGDDTYVVDNAGDVVTELADEGIDTVRSSLTYTLGANVENLLLTGSSAINGAGNALDNVLTGNSGINILTGGAGNDTLDGKAGADTMIGGTGDDTYYVDNTGDVVTENAGEGSDTVVSSIAWTLGANLENLTLSGSSAIAGTGNAADNILVGNAAANALWGRAGNDTLRGYGGADTLNGEEGDDFLDGGSGNDTLIGGVGNDTYWLARGYGNDTIQENDATVGNTDTARFDTGIAVDQLWFRHVGNNLEVSIIGTTDKFTIQNWYSGSAYHVEQFRTADDRLLLDSQVENLVQAMAAFSPPASGQTTLPQNYQDALSPVIAANWQ
ncbi:MAG: calcium-binding protein, partial [Sulfuritalea sp.]|nr:calcium-binding protein [Sulfuritalea sp.]